jgi:hypothetical protein
LWSHYLLHIIYLLWTLLFILDVLLADRYASQYVIVQYIFVDE